jgi:NTE family protein
VRADLVLEGGGAKAAALAGAVAGLADRGVEVARVAGTSAGAIVAALLAAGMPPEQLDQRLRGLDLDELVPPGPLEGLDRIGTRTRGLDVLLELGLHDQEPLRTWLRGQLHELGVDTFRDLRDEPDEEGRIEGRSRLGVAVTDLTRGRQVLLPWAYRDYGLDPDEQLVVDAVAAASAIPLIFEPARLPVPGADEPAVIVDGGLLSNLPLDVFDRHDDRPSRWPTIGVRLTSRPDATGRAVGPVDGAIEYLRALTAAAVAGWDQRHLDDPQVAARTVVVATTGVPAVRFDADAATRTELSDRGRDAAHRWFDEGDLLAG